MTEAIEEVWAADGEPVYERFALYSDGDLISEHMDCGVRLTANHLRTLAATALNVAERLEAGDDA